MLFTRRALDVKVKHGAQMVVHGQFFSLEHFVQVFFRLIHLMGRGVDWSRADVQFVRDGMAGGANLSLLARSRGWAVYTAWTQVDQNAVKRSIASWPKRPLLCLSSHTQHTHNTHTTHTNTHRRHTDTHTDNANNKAHHTRTNTRKKRKQSVKILNRRIRKTFLFLLKKCEEEQGLGSSQNHKTSRKKKTHNVIRVFKQLTITTKKVF